MLTESEFEVLRIKAAITPQSEGWPSGDIQPSILGDKPTLGGSPHWNALHNCVDDARTRTMKAVGTMAAIDDDKKLSEAGKADEKRKIAETALDGLRKSKAIDKAREAAAKVTQQCAAKVADVVKPAWDIAEATVHAQIRDRLAAMKDGRMSFLEKNATDPVIASAILTAPALLSGLSDPEVALVRHKVELQAVGYEALEARNEVVRALADCKQGLRNAVAEICERAGLPKTSNGAEAQV
jgi:hypothetical protein